LRPDYLLWLRNILIVKGEEKLDLSVAQGELVDKLAGTSFLTTAGYCNWVLAYAAAGHVLECCAIVRCEHAQHGPVLVDRMTGDWLLLDCYWVATFNLSQQHSTRLCMRPCSTHGTKCAPPPC
jgi:hypothetical protein